MRAVWLAVLAGVWIVGLGDTAAADILPLRFDARVTRDASLAPVSAAVRPRRIEVGGGPDPLALALVATGLLGLGLVGKPVGQPRGAGQADS